MIHPSSVKSAVFKVVQRSPYCPCGSDQSPGSSMPQSTGDCWQERGRGSLDMDTAMGRWRAQKSRHFKFSCQATLMTRGHHIHNQQLHTLDARHNRRRGSKIFDLISIVNFLRKWQFYTSIYKYFLHLVNIILLSFDSIPCNPTTEYHTEIIPKLRRKVNSRKNGLLAKHES